MKPNGYVLWRGASLLDSQPIVVIATGLTKASRNTKTGAMIQTWILRADVEPHIATKTGEDSPICGTCPHRGTALGDRNEGRACYVLVHNAPLAVYRAWKRGAYPMPWGAAYKTRKPHEGHLETLGESQKIRIGAYGDPAAVPTWVWSALVSRATNYTGYTHQWRTCDTTLQTLCMARVDSLAERLEAKGQGWRCFLVLPKDDRVTTDIQLARWNGSVICPASEERGKRTTCDKCNLCQGTNTKTSLDIVIAAHGVGASKSGR
jgi:hypothetical protein